VREAQLQREGRHIVLQVPDIDLVLAGVPGGVLRAGSAQGRVRPGRDSLPQTVSIVYVVFVERKFGSCLNGQGGNTKKMKKICLSPFLRGGELYWDRKHQIIKNSVNNSFI